MSEKEELSFHSNAAGSLALTDAPSEQKAANVS